MSKKTILLLEAGGPCGIACLHLLQKSRDAYRLIGADADPYSVASQWCDHFATLPYATHDGYQQALEVLIARFHPDLILPCFEHGFEICQRIDAPFVTDFRNALLCKNKYLFYQTAYALGLPVVETYPLETCAVLPFPLYIKPTQGVGSKNNFIIRTQQELDGIKLFLGEQVHQYIAQPYITRQKHRNIDVYADATGYKKSIARLDIKQQCGNCMTVEIIADTHMHAFAKKVTETLSIRSPCNIELFEDNEGNYLMHEINVRFGGGIIFGALGGCDFVNYLVTQDMAYIAQDPRPGVYARVLSALHMDVPSV